VIGVLLSLGVAEGDRLLSRASEETVGFVRLSSPPGRGERDRSWLFALARGLRSLGSSCWAGCL